MSLTAQTINILKDIKRRPPEKLDRIVHKIHEEVFVKTDCLSCAACCKGISPILCDHDILRLSLALKMDTSTFSQMYVTTDKDRDLVFNRKPCPFLGTNNWCGVYDDRPKACREYPHTDRRRFFQLIDLSIKNAQYCPAVSKILEKLTLLVEKDLKFRKR